MSQNSGLYDISKPRFDLETYGGRLAYFYSTTSPLTLLASSSQLAQAQKDATHFESSIKENGNKGTWVTKEQRDTYWNAKQLVNSSIHPDTGKPVPLPFRMSAFVPTNLIICAGMLTPNASLKSIIFWQWANQTLNVAVNFSNANKSIEMTPQEIGTAYTAATATSVLLAVSLTRLVPRLRVSPTAKDLLAKLVPFASVASAGVVKYVSLSRLPVSHADTAVASHVSDGKRCEMVWKCTRSPKTPATVMRRSRRSARAPKLGRWPSCRVLLAGCLPTFPL
ncbi:hypothetical protein, variant 6 [Cryptococcus amylolentus CBS 6039]|uniref:Tricarboxylate carrier n=1 Tax=Cryptococcus amylolentus CBS 6039 TaxID=1295533 RepID=A0A1E3HTC3_9TREE|nr:hypothetical protein, variant 4 [Cryptococcus amylolentus CBS 6039]XP_018994243.1 hypothetical protein, variant 5 [Cryptococcus amylolentus CBS 6039]XP_018994244.1 hypothetical protein, variant 6 [Cryptococcus amylolentus CBS 6039]ODN79395.1 hypothetical protein, variant 4 [Cryptococcus amylolentus CBS 6039]ODN79396.1 hypothetical protein, variant 5 [Cryptococcus amylolentus CBS 6039]ODN79397.1 hypothetical protein, variant 6 [Cryptococcus amylolentus CBS 6039]